MFRRRGPWFLLHARCLIFDARLLLGFESCRCLRRSSSTIYENVFLWRLVPWTARLHSLAGWLLGQRNLIHRPLGSLVFRMLILVLRGVVHSEVCGYHLDIGHRETAMEDGEKDLVEKPKSSGPDEGSFLYCEQGSVVDGYWDR